MEFRKVTLAGISYGDPPKSEDELEGNILPLSDESDEHTVELSQVPKEKAEGKEKPELEWRDERLVEHIRSDHPNREVIRKALTLLAVCHTVIPEETNGGIINDKWRIYIQSSLDLDIDSDS